MRFESRFGKSEFQDFRKKIFLGSQIGLLQSYMPLSSLELQQTPGAGFWFLPEGFFRGMVETKISLAAIGPNLPSIDFLQSISWQQDFQCFSSKGI